MHYRKNSVIPECDKCRSTDNKTEVLLQVDIPNDDEEYLADNFHSFIDTFCQLDTRCEPLTSVRITVERVTLDE
jgi:hypothetical protein